MSKVDKWARMANQIGDYFSAMPSEEAAVGVASHLRKFWTPKMIAEISAAIDENNLLLNSTALHGLTLLRKSAI